MDRGTESCPKGTVKSGYRHVPKKSALDESVYCIRCAEYLGEMSEASKKN